MNITEALRWRYATKRMNGQKVPQEKVARILEAACLAPSSYGLQPYAILVVEDEALREAIRPVGFSQPQITESSHLLVFAAWDSVLDAHVDEFIHLTSQERDVALAELEDYSSAIKNTVNGFTSAEDTFHWAAKQAYLSLGIALAAAAMEQVDATPMEGFDSAALDELLKLGERNLRSVVLMALGYRDAENDSLAGLKKVRWPREKLLIRMAPA